MRSIDASQAEPGVLAAVWATLPDVGEVRAVDAGDAAVFDDVRDVLQRHGALQRFGLTLLHRHFAIGEGECLLETTDIANRRQVVEVKKSSGLQGQRVIETQWAFDGSGTVFCVGFCNYNQGHRHHHNKQ